MRPLGLLFLLFLLSPVAALAQTDISVELQGDTTSVRSTMTYLVVVQWEGTQPAQNVVLEGNFPGEISHWYEGSMVCDRRGPQLRCTMPAAASHRAYVSVTVRFLTPGTYTATAHVGSDTPDPRPENNSARLTTQVAGMPSLRPYVVADTYEMGGAADPGGVGVFRMGIQNDGDIATNAVLRATLPEGGTFVSVDEFYGRWCTVAPTEVVCRFDKTSDSAQISGRYLAPDRTGGGTFPIAVSADADGEDWDPSDDSDRIEVPLRLLFAVTNGADEGAGSLRQAILESRVACETTPCLIAARAAEPLVIQPRTPLPALRGRMKVDGGAARTTLDGSLLPRSLYTDGPALVLEEGCDFRVNGMVIRDFPGHAIEALSSAPMGTSCAGSVFLTPAVITNNELTRNLRGVVTRRMSATITDNVIRDNGRSGIIADKSFYTFVERNQINNNGASGIFIDPPQENYILPSGADIIANEIHGNAHWGVTMTSVGSVHVVRNSISGNYLYGIDVGVDLDSPPANEPVLFSATYDPARGVTVLRGRLESPREHVNGISLDIYASSSLSIWGYPEAERWLVSAHPQNKDFEVVLPGDLRGQWITATGTEVTGIVFLRDGVRDAATPPRSDISRLTSYDTSELSNAVLAQ